MSRLLEFILGSILITVFTVAFLFFSAVHYVLRAGGVSDCTWYASAQTWIDTNADGLVDPGESPLGDVKIHINHTDDQPAAVSWPAITDQNGIGQLIVSIPGCAERFFEISVDIPEGYRLTTRPRLTIQPELWERAGARVYYFGFAPDR